MINYNQSFIALLNQFINKMSYNNDCLNKHLTQKLSKFRQLLLLLLSL